MTHITENLTLAPIVAEHTPKSKRVPKIAAGEAIKTMDIPLPTSEEISQFQAIAKQIAPDVEEIISSMSPHEQLFVDNLAQFATGPNTKDIDIQSVFATAQLSGAERKAQVGPAFGEVFTDVEGHPKQLTDYQIAGILAVHKMFPEKGVFELTKDEIQAKHKVLVEEYGLTPEEASWCLRNGWCGKRGERLKSLWQNGFWDNLPKGLDKHGFALLISLYMLTGPAMSRLMREWSKTNRAEMLKGTSFQENLLFFVPWVALFVSKGFNVMKGVAEVDSVESELRGGNLGSVMAGAMIMAVILSVLNRFNGQLPPMEYRENLPIPTTMVVGGITVFSQKEGIISGLKNALQNVSGTVFPRGGRR